MNTLKGEELAAKLADLASVAPDVELVVLFGSHARGRARNDSDLDVAVRCDAPADLDALYLLLAPRVGSDRLDLADLRRAGTRLAFEVARSGRLVYERRGGAFREFQSLASRRCCDTAARDLAPWAGLRNRFAREYDTIDDTKALQAIGTIRRQYPRYVQAIEQFLARADH